STTRANVDVAFLIEDEVSPAEGAIGSHRLVPHRNMGRNVTIHQPFEQPDYAISSVAGEPLRLQVKAAPDPLHHGFGDGNLHDAIGASALGVDDDPGLVVDQIVGIISKEWIDALPGDPCRLWISHRDFFGRSASTVATRAATI